MVLLLLLLLLSQFLLQLRPHLDGFAGLSISDVQSFRQLGKVLVDVNLL